MSERVKARELAEAIKERAEWLRDVASRTNTLPGTDVLILGGLAAVLMVLAEEGIEGQTPVEKPAEDPHLYANRVREELLAEIDGVIAPYWVGGRLDTIKALVAAAQTPAGDERLQAAQAENTALVLKLDEARASYDEAAQAAEARARERDEALADMVRLEAGLKACQRELERYVSRVRLAEQIEDLEQRLKQAESEKADLQQAIDTNVETMRLLCERAKQAERERDEALAVLNPSLPESGLVDACRQVKQAQISERDNCLTLEAREARLRAALEPLVAYWESYREADAGTDGNWRRNGVSDTGYVPVTTFAETVDQMVAEARAALAGKE